MSTSPASPATPDDGDDADLPLEHSELLELIAKSIEELAYKQHGEGRIRDKEAEQVRIRMSREVGYLASRYLEVLKDFEDREEAMQRLEEIESELPEL